MEMNPNIACTAELTATLFRHDGTVKYLGLLTRPWYVRMFDHWTLGNGQAGLVTNAGVDYMATDFTSALSSPRIGAFQYHDCGTGTSPAAVTDTALQTPAGTARVAGTASNPSANIYKTVATISYTSTLAITEWGLFSASSSGTLWDHRVFSAINVVNLDSIQFSYSLTISSGGS